MSALRLALLPALSLLAFGCARTPPEPTTPVGAYERFLQRVQRVRQGGRDVSLLEAFDTESRARLEQGRARWLQLVPDAGEDEGEFWLIRPAARMPAGASVRLVEESGDVASVEVGVDGGTLGRVQLRRESGGWRIHLEEPVRQIPPSDVLDAGIGPMTDGGGDPGSPPAPATVR